MKSSEMRDLMKAFEEATSITMSLVAFPVILLFVGVFIDKTLSTTPFFIFLGIIGGVAAGIYQAMRVSKKYPTSFRKIGTTKGQAKKEVKK